jgi:hypothetical protein
MRHFSTVGVFFTEEGKKEGEGRLSSSFFLSSVGTGVPAEK